MKMAVLLLLVFMNFVGVGALALVLPFNAIDHLGCLESVMMLLLASFSLAIFIWNTVLGRLLDRLAFNLY